MTELEAKAAALKFALDMCHETRRATIEDCAKVVDNLMFQFNHTQEIAKAIRALNVTKE